MLQNQIKFSHWSVHSCRYSLYIKNHVILYNHIRLNRFNVVLDQCPQEHTILAFVVLDVAEFSVNTSEIDGGDLNFIASQPLLNFLMLKYDEQVPRICSPLRYAMGFLLMTRSTASKALPRLNC